MNFNLKFCILANNFPKYFTKYSFCFLFYLFIYFNEVSVLLDGAKNHLNVRIKTKSVTAGADATEYVWRLFSYIASCQKTIHTGTLQYTVASTPTVAGSVF